ncbi:YceI family protein [Pseudaquabacterium pictum]|uniref:Polyisoprenoid-binding protein n=1 Tax=Pseudaquabacterium pictum TaxID=2315236 RepID=A0A480AYH4_9BURK|nr:YceI family protein [Rubrivivax pictus]GCL65312.1 polyisoprenoid-binding protein [Rubrivivax pictus]
MIIRTALLATALAAATVAAQAQTATYAIDPTHTFVTFEVPHFGVTTNRGRFDKKTGAVQFDKAGKAGKVEITIETGSINTGTTAFDKHLQSKDFFNSAEFPTAKFVADKFSFNGEKVSEVTGTLTLLGKTNPVVLKATNFGCYQNPMLKVEVCGGDFETTITRSQWGMTWGLNFGISDAVRLVVQVEGIKQP